MTWLVLAAAVTLLGCESSSGLIGDATLDGPDVTIDTTDAPDLDAIPDPDALEDTTEVPCEPAYWWELVDRTITSVELIDGVSPRMGVTERMMVEVQLQSACERLAWIEVGVMPGDATDFVDLRAQAWAPTGLDCPPSAPIVEWMVTVEGRQHGNFMAVVHDATAAPGEGTRLNYSRERCEDDPDCACWSGSPGGTAEEGERCLTDCSCAEGLSCIGFHGMAGPMHSCLIPCNDLLDCPDDHQCIGPVLDYTSNVCEAGSSDCNVDGDCPTGFVCDMDPSGVGDCIDTRVFTLISPFCECDEQCPSGQHCTLWDPEADTMCQIPCLRDVECDDHGTCEHGVCRLPPP